MEYAAAAPTVAPEASAAGNVSEDAADQDALLCEILETPLQMDISELW